MKTETTIYDELKSKWIERGGIINDQLQTNTADKYCDFIITNELEKDKICIEPCLVATAFSNFSCNKFVKTDTLLSNTLFKSCLDCKVIGDAYGYCQLENCKKYYSNPLKIKSGGDWSLKISKMTSENINIINVMMDYIIFMYKNNDEKTYSTWNTQFKMFSNISKWDEIYGKSLCCSFHMESLDYKNFGGTDGPIINCICICGDGNGDCFFVQQNNTIFILDYETS